MEFFSVFLFFITNKIKNFLFFVIKNVDYFLACVAGGISMLNAVCGRPARRIGGALGGTPALESRQATQANLFLMARTYEKR